MFNSKSPPILRQFLNKKKYKKKKRGLVINKGKQKHKCVVYRTWWNEIECEDGWRPYSIQKTLRKTNTQPTNKKRENE